MINPNKNVLNNFSANNNFTFDKNKLRNSAINSTNSNNNFLMNSNINNSKINKTNSNKVQDISKKKIFENNLNNNKIKTNYNFIPQINKNAQFDFKPKINTKSKLIDEKNHNHNVQKIIANNMINENKKPNQKLYLY